LSWRGFTARPWLEVLEDRTLPSTTYTVTNTGDNSGANPMHDAGTGTLRQAIVDANYHNTGAAASPDLIQFNILTSDSGYHAAAATLGITNVSLSASVATLTTSAPVPFVVGQTITVAGLSNSFFDGNYPISAVTATSISYALVHADVPPTGDSGTASNPSWFTIQPLSGLPTVTDVVVLDGYTQAGASANTLAVGDNAVLKIVLDGSLAGPAEGLVIGGGNSTVRGLVIDSFAGGSTGGDAIVLTGSGHDVVSGNFIGVDVAGQSAAANGGGVSIINASNNIVGGTAPGARNLTGYVQLLSGNINTPTSGNFVQGNYIGTDRGGTAALGPVVGSGVALVGNVSNNVIGGTTASAGNVIGGKLRDVIFAGGGLGDPYPGPAGNLVEGNHLGTNAAGTAVISGLNRLDLDGVFLAGGSSNNTIGGTTPGAGNLISGHGDAGIDIACRIRQHHSRESDRD
jgi:hypothetical protein